MADRACYFVVHRVLGRSVPAIFWDELPREPIYQLEYVVRLDALPEDNLLRLMVGLRDGARQGHVPANLSRAARRDAYIKHAYNPARLGDLYPFLYDALLRAQWRGDRDGVPAHPIGPYGVYYGTKKAEYLARFEGQKGWRTHADMAARRYAAKMFLRDLWRAW